MCSTCSGPQVYFVTSFQFDNLVSQQNQSLVKSKIQAHVWVSLQRSSLPNGCQERSFSLISWATFLHCNCWTLAQVVGFHVTAGAAAGQQCRRNPSWGSAAFQGAHMVQQTARMKNSSHQAGRERQKTASAASQQESFPQEQLKVSFVPQCCAAWRQKPDQSNLSAYFQAGEKELNTRSQLSLQLCIRCLFSVAVRSSL